MKAGTGGTKRYKHPTVPTAKKVQIGTQPFRVYLLYLDRTLRARKASYQALIDRMVITGLSALVHGMTVSVFGNHTKVTLRV